LLIAVIGVYSRLRRGWWWRRNRSTMSTESTIMIILAIVASLAGIAVLCRLLFTLAVFALPFFAAMAGGGWAFATGAGIAGAVLLAAIATSATYALFPLLLPVLRRNRPKPTVALAFAAPSTLDRHHAHLGFVRLTMPS